jgi:hypothetical protein
MRRDDILINELYSRINNPIRDLSHLEENIFQSARKWFDRMSNVPEQNIDDVAYAALKKAAQEVERAGFDSSKIMSLDFIAKFKDTIKKTDDSEQSTVDGDTEVTSQEQPTETPSFNPQPESKDDLKFAPKSETIPTTQSAQPKTNIKSTPTRIEPPKRQKFTPTTSSTKQFEVKPGMMTISKFKELQQMSDDEFNYLRRNYLIGVKPPLMPIDYLDDPEVQQILASKEESKKVATTKKPAVTKKATATKPAAVKKPAVARKSAAVKKPSKTSAAIRKATPK